MRPGAGVVRMTKNCVWAHSLLVQMETVVPGKGVCTWVSTRTSFQNGRVQTRRRPPSRIAAYPGLGTDFVRAAHSISTVFNTV
eukprot:2917773-Rhodomonas_salina.2